MKASWLAVAVAVVVLAGGVASAVPVSSSLGPNLVVNGGFETGDLTGWTLSGNTGFTGVSLINPHSGSFALYEGPMGSLGFISQDILTVPGEQYNIDLWFLASGSTPNELRIDWGGVTVFDQTNFSAGPYVDVLLDPPAAPLTTLSIGFRNDPAFDYIDDISVRSVSVIPEPMSLTLLGLGLGSLGIFRRKSK